MGISDGFTEAKAASRQSELSQKVDAPAKATADSLQNDVETFMVQHTKGSSWKKVQNKSLFQLGLDSLEIVQVRNLFNKRFSTNVPLGMFADASQKVSDLAIAVCEHVCSMREK